MYRPDSCESFITETSPVSEPVTHLLESPALSEVSSPKSGSDQVPLGLQLHGASLPGEQHLSSLRSGFFYLFNLISHHLRN